MKKSLLQTLLLFALFSSISCGSTAVRRNYIISEKGNEPVIKPVDEKPVIPK